MPVALNRTARYQPALFLYCVAALVVAALVLVAGAQTTSTQSGMAFLTWPSSNGSLNPPGWLENTKMFLEHSHRLLAGTLCIFTVGAAIWIYLTEPRRWVWRLSLVLVGTILVQAVLGGLRVKLDQLNTHWYYNTAAQTMAVFHAGTAQITVCLWVTLTAAVSRAWTMRGAGSTLVAPSVRTWAAATVGILFIQVIIGAIMRHGGYALAISTFPWSGPDHALLPTQWNWPAIVNFAHRLGATLVTLAFVRLTVSVFANLATTRRLANLMAVILCILVLQIFLGAEVIWSNKDAYYATAHMVTGAFLLASTWLLTLLCYRSAWWPPEAVEPARAS